MVPESEGSRGLGRRELAPGREVRGVGSARPDQL